MKTRTYPQRLPVCATCGNPEHDVDCGSCIEACRVLALDALKLKQEVKP